MNFVFVERRHKEKGRNGGDAPQLALSFDPLLFNWAMLRDPHTGALPHSWGMTWLLRINLSGAAAAGNYCNATTAASLIGVFLWIASSATTTAGTWRKTGNQLESDRMKYDD